jgi:hypothetical protein
VIIEVYHALVSRQRIPDRSRLLSVRMALQPLRHDHRAGGAPVEGDDLLAAVGISYRLADSGEDLGRLAEIFDDGRA